MPIDKSKCYLDRYLKLFFNEQNFFKYIDIIDNSDSSTQNQYLKNNGEFFTKYVEEVVKSSYKDLYGPQYNIREVDMIMKDYLNNYGCTEDEEKFSFLNMIDKVSERYYVNVGDKTHIKSEKLFDYLGFNNKVGTMFMVANMANSTDMLLKQSSLISIDSAVVKTNYFNSIHETHMHYKASGFGVESSWVYFMNLNGTDFEKGIKKYSDSKGLSVKERNLIRVARIIRYKFTHVSPHKINNSSTFNDYLRLLLSDASISFPIYDSQIKINKTTAYLVDYIVKDKNYSEKDEMDHILSERLFHYEAQEKLKEKNTTFDEFLYFIYVIAYSMFCKKEIQQDDIVGFERFKDFEETKNIVWNVIKESRSNNFVNKHDTYEVLTTIRKYQDDNVNYVEFRTVPGNKDRIKQIFENAKNAINHTTVSNEFKYKMIFHFVKTKSFLRKQTINNYYDEIKAFRTIYLQQLKDIKKSSSLFKQTDRITAIDTCNHETEVSTWVFAPIYHRREDLRATYHAGEDFYTLVQGIRSIENVIDYLGYKKGDRIGHASAILIDVDFVYKKKNYLVYSRQLDNFDDLAVIYKSLKEMYFENGMYLSRLADSFYVSLNKMLTKISSHYYPLLKDVNIHDWYYSIVLRNFDEKIFDEHKIDFLNKENQDEEIMKKFINYRDAIKKEVSKGYYRDDLHKEIDKALNSINSFIIYNVFMQSKSFRKYSLKPFNYKIDEDYVEAIKCYQQSVREKMINNEYVAEINLTSNYLINDYDKYNQHGLYNVRNFKFNNTDKNILISIGTDDSAVFGTSMFFELQIMYMVLIEKGYDVEEAINEVKKIVNLSNRLSFIEE